LVTAVITANTKVSLLNNVMSCSFITLNCMIEVRRR